MGGRALPDPKNLIATSLAEKCPAGFFKRWKGARVGKRILAVRHKVPCQR